MNVCRAPNETFSLVQSSQLSGKLSRLKNTHAGKKVHASRLNANGSSRIMRSCPWGVMLAKVLGKVILTKMGFAKVSFVTHQQSLCVFFIKSSICSIFAAVTILFSLKTCKKSQWNGWLF